MPRVERKAKAAEFQITMWHLNFLLWVVALMHATTSTSNAFEFDLGPINVLIVTDVHSWVAGHIHEPDKDVDYGHVLSFYERLKAYCDEQGQDLFFVMNGDFMDGTGLSTVPPEQLLPLLQQMPFDALNIGNHELYYDEVIEYIKKPNGFVDFWDKRYLTTNTYLTKTNQPIGERYMYLKGIHSNTNILTFGFLYNMKDNCETTTIQEVQEVVSSEWFINLLQRDDFDAILVLAHMDAYDPLVKVILDPIRSICGDDMPVQFVTGHSHMRRFTTLDEKSTSFEAGKYLDTIGFVTFPTKDASVADIPFEHHFIEPNVKNLEDILDVETLETETGKELSKSIRKAQESLGLFDLVGCAPKTYHLFSTLDKDDSLWGLYKNEVMPMITEEPSTTTTSTTTPTSSNEIMIQSSGAFRYNLYEGNVTVNDLISINPFNDRIMRVAKDVSGHDFMKAFGGSLLTESTVMSPEIHHTHIPHYVICCDIDPDTMYDVYTVHFDVPHVIVSLEQVTHRTFEAEDTTKGTIDTYWRKFVSEDWKCHDVEEADDMKSKSWIDTQFESLVSYLSIW